MKLRNKKTKSPVIGTADILTCTALVTDFCLGVDGRIGVEEYEGETQIDWNSQYHERSKKGHLMLVCEDGNTCAAPACEPYEEGE